MSSVQWLKTIDFIQDAYEAGSSTNLAAGLAKLASMAAVGVITDATLRTAMPMIRLGFAVSGRIDQWEKWSAFGGWAAGEVTGALIDEFNNLAIGSRFFDLTRVDPRVNTSTTDAINWVPPRRDPLVLDLDGNGITTSGFNPAAPILFDQDGDGTLTATGWIAAGEAIVVRDLNGNGRIDSERELFGDNTLLTRGPNVGKLASNGFTALADLDANAAGVADGKFDASDVAALTAPQPQECRMPYTPGSRKFGLHCAKSGSSRRARRHQCRCGVGPIRMTSLLATSLKPHASHGWRDPGVFQEQHVYPQPQLQTATL